MQQPDAFRPELPSKAQILQLPVFKNLPRSSIVVLQTTKQCQEISAALHSADYLGFDTESKPTFNVGDVSTGPHVIQLATAKRAYIFYANHETWAFLTPILENKDIIKIGFGLKNDRALFNKKGIQLDGLIDLSKAFSAFGVKQTLGIKTAVACLLQQQFIKSKKISTSNWSAQPLSEAQIAYAAADAYGCVMVYQKLVALRMIMTAHPPNSIKPSL